MVDPPVAEDVGDVPDKLGLLAIELEAELTIELESALAETVVVATDCIHRSWIRARVIRRERLRITDIDRASVRAANLDIVEPWTDETCRG